MEKSNYRVGDIIHLKYDNINCIVNKISVIFENEKPGLYSEPPFLLALKEKPPGSLFVTDAGFCLENK